MSIISDFTTALRNNKEMNLQMKHSKSINKTIYKILQTDIKYFFEKNKVKTIITLGKINFSNVIRKSQRVSLSWISSMNKCVIPLRIGSDFNH